MEAWRMENMTAWTRHGREVFRQCVCGRTIGWDGHPYMWCDIPGAREAAAIDKVNGEREWHDRDC